MGGSNYTTELITAVKIYSASGRACIRKGKPGKAEPKVFLNIVEYNQRYNTDCSNSRIPYKQVRQLTFMPKDPSFLPRVPASQHI